MLSLCLIAILGIGLGDDPTTGDLNAKVVEFARSNLGEQVGDGICATLVREALKEAGAHAMGRLAENGETLWGEPVESLKEAKPGDIIQFEGVKFVGKRRILRDDGQPALVIRSTTFPNHSAIITGVGAKGKSVTIHHQNSTDFDGTPIKRVTEATLFMSERRKGGTIKIYRPVSKDSKFPADRPLASLGRMD